MIRFAYIYLGILGFTSLITILLYKLKFYKPITYKYSLVSYLRSVGVKSFSFPSQLFFGLRLMALSLLAILVFKPQLVNFKSPTKIEGLDIMLTLDVSQSMLFFDDLNDQRSRFEVAKQEAIKFIEKRKNDSIGLVIFGKHAVTRAPLTLDKNMLKSILEDLKIGFIDGEGTAISTSLLASANRLKNSDAVSKIIIFLTDGQPTVRDIDPHEAIKILQKLGIKVYTIGIGGKGGGYFNHPFLGTVSAQNTLNTELLKKIAYETGGEFFLAENPKDMEDVYNYIDKLEKTKHETKIYYNYFDWFMPFIGLALLFLLIELLLSTWMWFIV